MKEPTPVTFIQEQDALGAWHWTMRCGHAEVTSAQAYLTFSKDLIESNWLFWAEDLPLTISDQAVSMIAMYSLLGRLLEVTAGCPCGLSPVRADAVLAASRKGARA